MSKAPNVPRRYQPDAEWVDPAQRPATMSVQATEPEHRILYGPKGETLATISDRPPVGFHQGSRGR